MNTIPASAVVVGVDGSPQAWQALTWAAERAEATGRPLHVLHAEGALSAPYDLTPVERPLDSVCDEAVRRVRDRHPKVPVTSSQPSSAPTPALMDASAVADEIVIGTRGMSAIRGAVLGSVATELTASAHCPVIVVRGPSPDGLSAGPVVVGVDGRPDGAAALDFAFADAERRGVPLVAVLAWQLDRWDFASGIPMPGGDLKAANRYHADRLKSALAGPAARHPGVEVESVVECAPTAGALTQRSAGASLLVVGTRGHYEITGLVLGSVSQAMMRRAACPVAVVAHARVDHPAAVGDRMHTTA